jgi:HupE / UreJ protein
MRSRRAPWLWLPVSLLLAAMAQAHVASNGFLALNVRGNALSGSVELAVRDVELAVGADANGDGRVTWGELHEAAPRLAAYVAAHLQFAADGGGCTTHFGELQVTARVDGNYAWLPFTSTCRARPHELDIHYRVLEGIDPSHRGLLRLDSEGAVTTAVLGGAAADVPIALGHNYIWRTIGEYLRAGVWHIWSGIDHLLFLLSLLLPAVLQRRQGHWEPVPSGRPAFLGILKVVTAFTLAHSITLSLAALDVVRLPSRFTESVIAASIIVAALNNIFPLVTETRARIAFAFGLLHGFGFASVLAEMGLPAGARLASLLAFNCGIEAGQLAVVCAVMPLAYALRRGVLYQRALLPWGSAAIAAVALVWFVQRAFLPQ